MFDEYLPGYYFFSIHLSLKIGVYYQITSVSSSPINRTLWCRSTQNMFCMSHKLSEISLFLHVRNIFHQATLKLSEIQIESKIEQEQ